MKNEKLGLLTGKSANGSTQRQFVKKKNNHWSDCDFTAYCSPLNVAVIITQIWTTEWENTGDLGLSLGPIEVDLFGDFASDGDSVTISTNKMKKPLFLSWKHKI